MAKKKLPPVPRPTRSAKEQAAAIVATDAAPDLSWIAEGLRPLAVPIGSIDFDPANARVHGEDNLATIRGSLRSYGQRVPLVVNKRTGTIEKGNGTLRAALALGKTHIAVLFVDDDPTAAAGFSIADNRAAELGTWDDKALDALLRTAQYGDQDLADMATALAEAEDLIPDDEDDGNKPADEKKFGVVVLCRDAEHQETVYQRLLKDGYECKVKVKVKVKGAA